jgi:hypothetical protein
MAMVCSKCGAERLDGANFCVECGARFQPVRRPDPPGRQLVLEMAGVFVGVVLFGLFFYGVINGVAPFGWLGAPPAPVRPSLQISSIGCTATVDYGTSDIYFTIHIAGTRTGTGEFSETVLGHNVGSVEYPSELRSSLSSADGQTVLGGGFVSGLFEPEGCSGGGCVGGVLHTSCRWASEGDL